jgi:hypothetical protein
MTLDSRSGVCPVHHSQGHQGNARQAEAEFLQGAPAGDGLGHALGQFTRCGGATARRVELVIHNFPFVLVGW